LSFAVYFSIRVLSSAFIAGVKPLASEPVVGAFAAAGVAAAVAADAAAAAAAAPAAAAAAAGLSGSIAGTSGGAPVPGA
jgi:hypothetical protein